uniref:Uncharacterized protein LOC111134310 n=1 Tax=Crassostrea virginica TaxID=6565 RepID=A0A8B8EGU8_CRAVI|nr:uncharacterized protein LOC111134310 [Crassostrea virginica]
MADELQLRNESWSEGLRARLEELLPARKKSRSNKRGTRRCAVSGCAFTFDGAAPMVRHVWEEHCPARVEEPDFLVQFLREIARLLHLPQERRDDKRALDDLRTLVQRSFRPVLWGFAGRWLDKANALAERVGMAPVSSLDLELMRQGLIAHPGMLAHPRIIAIALNNLTHVERQHVRQMSLVGSHSLGVARAPKGKPHGGFGNNSVVVDAPFPHSNSGEIPICTGNWESEYAGSQKQRELSPPIPCLEVIDAHWHPTRMSVRLDLASLTTEIGRLPGSEECPVSVVGGCAVYVDGPIFSGVYVPAPGWVTAVGFHPTEVKGITESSIGGLVDHCVKMGWAIGEVGLDYFWGKGWSHQRWVLGEIFRLVTPRTPIVLHLRGVASDHFGQEPMMDCQNLLVQLRVSLLVPLYLHSFSGGPSQVDEWLATGRVVFFGVSWLVQHFSQEQLQGLRRVPFERLLVESDCSHLRVRDEMIPGRIGLTYRFVAKLLNVGVPELVCRVKENFHVLFAQQLRGNHSQ